MESARPHADRSASEDGVPKRRRRFIAATATVCALVLAAPPVSASAAPAKPKPSTAELRKRLSDLNNQIEKLAEQYNGQRIKLRQAKKSARIAAADSRSKGKKLTTAQGKVRRLAATSYMTGGTDPSIRIATGNGDPRVAISQSTMLHHIATTDGAEVNGLARAQRAASRASTNARKRVKAVQKIVDRMKKKKDRIEGLVSKVQGNVFSRVLSKGEGVNTIKPSDIPGKGKGVEALRKALSQQGKPYVWGAAGPNSFDCSGLTMWAYKQVGISLPHYTVSQYHASHKVTHPRAGDLVFFYPPSMHHMGMYIGNGLMVHAPQTGDVVRVAKIGNRPIAGYARPY